MTNPSPDGLIARAEQVEPLLKEAHRELDRLSTWSHRLFGTTDRHSHADIERAVEAVNLALTTVGATVQQFQQENVRLEAEVGRMIDARMVLGNEMQQKLTAADAHRAALTAQVLELERHIRIALSEVRDWGACEDEMQKWADTLATLATDTGRT